MLGRIIKMGMELFRVTESGGRKRLEKIPAPDSTKKGKKREGEGDEKKRR